jgi:hypothetical protein
MKRGSWTIELTDEERDMLQELARQDMRSPVDEIRAIIKAEAVRLGLIAGPPPSFWRPPQAEAKE